MLVHQAKRLQSPCMMITNHDAAIMPNISVTNPENPSEKINLKFDRILCDVPCGGDGTIRKNADIWPVIILFDVIYRKMVFFFIIVQKINKFCDKKSFQFEIFFTNLNFEDCF